MVGPGEEWPSTEAVQSRVVTASTIIDIPSLFAAPFHSSLSYRETFYPFEINIHGESDYYLRLDEERILIFQRRGMGTTVSACKVLTV